MMILLTYEYCLDVNQFNRIIIVGAYLVLSQFKDYLVLVS